MSNFQIHELNSVAVNRNSNIIHDTEVSTDEWDTGKDIAGAVADLASANVAAPYDSTVTYAIGQYCLYEGDIYRCIAITTGAFDPAAWTQIVVSGEFRRVVELTSAQYAALTLAEQNNGTIYVKTDEETTAADISYTSGVSVADKLDSLPTSGTDIVKIISNEPWSTETEIAQDTEYNSSTPISITGIPSGYTVIGVSNVRVRGYYGSRGVAYAWLEDSTHFGYSIYNAANRAIKVILTVSFICVKTAI